mmetsp:Transcript_8397/g.16019  ORF Transcript_8397/g.16019 Transcript_8397/m.16019 type:complete len:102 (-) Transcript_8397:357-662(-)
MPTDSAFGPWHRRYRNKKKLITLSFTNWSRALFRPPRSHGYLEIIARMRDEDGIPGLILGCTKKKKTFLLIADDDMGPEFAVFDTAALHCRAVVEFALSES